MADDEKKEAGPDDFFKGMIGPLIGLSLIGSAARICPAMNQAPQKGEVLLPADAKAWNDWAAKAPALLRAATSTLPDTTESTGHTQKPFKIAGSALGIALGIASFTRLIRGKWRLLSGGAAAASAIGGLTYKRTEKVENVSAPEVEKLYNEYAELLERSPELRQKLADFLASEMTSGYVVNKAMESAVLEKTVEFGQKIGDKAREPGFPGVSR